jgi:hypothetical protein
MLRTTTACFVMFAALVATATAQVVAAPVLYRLDAPASYEEGCQPPCACPIWTTDDLFGTLTVRFDHSDPAWFDHYVIDDVNWVIDALGNQWHVSGNGVYKVGGQFAIRQQLQLILSIDGAAPVRFDSGLVLGGGTFPALAIDIAQNGFFCWDRVFRLHASAVPAGQSVPYRLWNASYLEGCWPPCLCPLLQLPSAGRFDLIDLGPASDPAKQHYALVNIDWRTRSAPANANSRFRGFGLYSLDATTAQHRLICDLTDATGVEQRFDSGHVPGGVGVPASIDIDIAQNGFYCYDRVFQLSARP